MAERLRHPSAPLALLAVLSVCSLVARVAWLGAPCRVPCRSAADHVLIFDEAYYVNAARVIAGIRPPAGATYATAPLGVDPNSEHPQLVKLVIAGSIELLGDQPIAWRLGSLILGSAAILGMFALARAAGAGSWPALTAAALMALDNLQLVHARIATLDVYVLAAMIWAAVLYMRGRWIAAGVLVGIGTCMKLVAPEILLGLSLLELSRPWLAGSATGRREARRVILRLCGCAAIAGVVFLGLLAGLDRVAPSYDQSARHRITGGPFAHVAHMLSFSAHQTSPHGPHGIASYPWQWLVDLKPIVYLNINPAQPSPALAGVHPAAHFLGMISPPLLLAAIPALLLGAFRSRWREERIVLVGLAWFLGTLVPFVLLSAIWKRTSYLYYMVIVLPGMYLLVADFVWRHRARAKLLWGWAGLLFVAAVLMYPFTPLP